MITSTKELKQRLANFLADPKQEQDFRVWFASVLRDAHQLEDPETEALAHEIMWIFYDNSRGFCTVVQLTERLTKLANTEVLVL